jgi:hypothetical protein
MFPLGSVFACARKAVGRRGLRRNAEGAIRATLRLNAEILMGLSHYVIGTPPDGEGGPEDLAALAKDLGPRLKGLVWSSEEFMLPEVIGEDGEIFIFVKPSPDDHEALWEEYLQSGALMIALRRVRPRWRWTLSDDVDTASTFWDDDEVTLVTDEDEARFLEVLREEMVREVLDRILG